MKRLLGKTLKAVYEDPTSSSIMFETDDGLKFKMHHEQDCCEGVYVEDIAGDLNDLVGNPLFIAEERTQDKEDVEYGCGMWTFYELATIKGSVTIRWYGESNGYYSVAVNFEETK